MNAKLQKARIGLLLDEPFFGALLLNLKVSEQKIGTMATDSVRLVYDPAFVDKLSPAVSAETIYGQLAEKPKDDPNGKPQHNPGNSPGNGSPGQGNGKAPAPASSPADSNDPGGMGAVEDYKAATEAEQNAQEARWKVALSQAANLGKGRGQLPGDLARLIGDILNPKADWRELLRRFIKDRAKDDYSWTRPNPRYLQSGFILPSLDSQRLGKIAVAIDTSGSIDATLLDSFMTEVESIVHEARPSTLTFIDCDAQVNSVRNFEPGETLPRDFAGGGGTNFSPVFELLNQDDTAPACLVYLTDLDGHFPDCAPAFPVIWAATSDRTAPFGEIVRLN